MKIIRNIILTIVVTIILLSTVEAQNRKTITGYQERMPGVNAEIHCDGVRLTRTMVIDSISGWHSGFWITKGNKMEKACWNLRQVDSCIGYELKPGTYYVYPNLKSEYDTASITIWMKDK